MIFFELLTYVVLGLSVSYMWSFSEIFSPIRNAIARIPYIRKPLICPECSSFWMGIIVSLFYNPLYSILSIYSYAFCGLTVHLFACFFYKLHLKN